MGNANGVRPTKRLLDALDIRPPTVDQPLQHLPDQPIPQAQSMPMVFESGGVKRIRSLKDRVWFKLKSGRWRGAVVRLTDADLAHDCDAHESFAIRAGDRWWLGAAGRREDGSRRDFYEEVTARAACIAHPDKPDGIDTDDLLPQLWDRRRLAAEEAYQKVQVYKDVMLEAAAKSLRTGKVVTASFAAYSMGVVIRAERGEQFVAFIAKNVLDVNVLAVMLTSFPGINKEDWAPEPGGAFDLAPAPGEVIYSAVLPSDVADDILGRVPWAAD